MDITISEYLQTELPKLFGSHIKLSKKEIGENLLIGHLFANGQLHLKDVLGIPQKRIEYLYAAAFELYQKDQIKDANRLFLLLCAYDPTSIRFWEGWAITSKLLQQHADALIAYQILTDLNPIKISYYLDLAEEFCKMKQIEPAIKCCEAIEYMAKEEPFSSENPDAPACLQKATILHKALTKKS